jgi:hypothetical protein
MERDIIRKGQVGQRGNPGQFASQTHSDATGITLDDTADWGEFVERDVPEILRYDGLVLRPHRIGEVVQVNSGTWNLASPVAEWQREGEFRVQEFGLGSKTFANARVDAAAAAWKDTRPEEVEAAYEWLDGGFEPDKKVSFMARDRKGAIVSIEGRTYLAGDQPAVILKNQRAQALYIEKNFEVLAIRDGYGHTEQLAGELAQVGESIPVVAPVNLDGIPGEEDWDDSGEPPNAVAAAFIVDGPKFPGESGDVSACVFFATDHQDGEILNGYFWAHGESGLYSEHGSMYVSELKQRGGARVANLDQQSGVSFGDVMRLDIDKRADMMRWLKHKAGQR